MSRTMDNDDKRAIGEHLNWLDARVVAKDAEIERLKAALVRQGIATIDSEREANTLRTENARLRAENKHLHVLCYNLGETQNALTTENDTLRTENDRLKADINLAVAMYDKSLARVEEGERLLAGYAGELNRVRDERDELKAVVTDALLANGKLQDKLDLANSALEPVRQERNELRTRLASYESPNGAATACPYAIIDTLTAELKLSQTDRDEMVDEIVRLEASINYLKTELNESQILCESHQDNCNRLITRLAEVTKSRDYLKGCAVTDAEIIYKREKTIEGLESRLASYEKPA